jgi:hypothetical protein
MPAPLVDPDGLSCELTARRARADFLSLSLSSGGVRCDDTY